MRKKKTRTPKNKSKISRTRQIARTLRKTVTRKMRASAEAQSHAKTEAAPAAAKPEFQQTPAGLNRAKGLELFKVAGRPTNEQVIMVYGERGPRMTWAERAKAGVPAEKFQAALAEKAVSRPAATKPARTTRQAPTPPLAGT